MMLRKIMSKLGVGAAKVDLVLHSQQVALGEAIEGEFHIEGGTVKQNINKLEVELLLKVMLKGKQFTKTITVIPITSVFTIQPGEKKSIPFHYKLPLNLPITRNGIQYTFVTKLDIAGGVDTLDHDAITITPPVQLENIFAAMSELGFREKATSGKITKYSQEFEFFPANEWTNHIQEIEFKAFIEDHGIRLYLEVDIYEALFKEKELKREMYISNEILSNPKQIAIILREAIQEMIQHPSNYYQPMHTLAAPKHQMGSSLSGAVGGFAAGLFAGMLLDEIFEEAAENAFDLEDHAGDLLDFGDFFDGGGEDF
jgi:sporulation-control protein